MINVQQLADALLPGTRPYVVLESNDPPQSVRLPGAIGSTSRTLDLILESWLTDRGEWRGRHPAIFIADETIHGLVATEVECDQVTAATTAHEAAHICESDPDLSAPTAERREFAETIAAYSINIADASPFPPMYGHSAQFIRLAIHTWYRASQLGFCFPVNFLFEGASYGLPAEPCDFAYALGREPECLADVSLFEIRKFRPPLEFIRLWRRCVRHWIDQQPVDAPSIAVATQLLNTFEV